VLIAVSIWLAVGLYLVLFFAVLHLVDSLAGSGLAASGPDRGSSHESEGA